MEMTFLFKFLLSITLCLLWPAACLSRPPETKAVDRPMVEVSMSEKDMLDSSERKKMIGENAMLESSEKQKLMAEKAMLDNSEREKMMAEKTMLDSSEREKKMAEKAMLDNSKKLKMMAEKTMLDNSDKQKMMAEKTMLDNSDNQKMMEEKTMLDNSDKQKMMAEKAMLDNSDNQKMMAEKTMLDNSDNQKMMEKKAMLESSEKQKTMAEKAMLDSSEKQKMMEEKKYLVSVYSTGHKTQDKLTGKSPQTSMTKSLEDQMPKPSRKSKDKHTSKMLMKKPFAMPTNEANKKVDQFSRNKSMSKPKDLKLVKSKSWLKSSFMNNFNENKEKSPNLSLQKPWTKSPLRESRSTLKPSLSTKGQLPADSLSKSDDNSTETVLDKLADLQNLLELAHGDRLLQKLKTEEELLTQSLWQTEIRAKKLSKTDELQQMQEAVKTKPLLQEASKEDRHTFLSEKKMATSAERLTAEDQVVVQTAPKQTVDSSELKSPSSSTAEAPGPVKPERQLHGLRTRREAQKRRSGKSKASGSGGAVPMYRMMKAMMGGDRKVAEQRGKDSGDEMSQKMAEPKGSAMGPKLMENMMEKDFKKMSDMDSKSGKKGMKEMTGKEFRKKMAYIMPDTMGEEKMKQMMGEVYTSKMKEMMGDKMSPQTRKEMMGEELSKMIAVMSPDEMKEMMEKHSSKMLEKMVDAMRPKETREMMEEKFSRKMPNNNKDPETMKEIMGEGFSKKMIEIMHGKMEPDTSKDNKIIQGKLEKTMMAEMMADKEKLEAMKAMMESDSGLAKIKDLIAGHNGQDTFEIMCRLIGLAKMKEIMNSETGENKSVGMDSSNINEKETSLKSEAKQDTSDSGSDKDVKLENNQKVEDNQTLTTQSSTLRTASVKLTPPPAKAPETEVTTVTSRPGPQEADSLVGGQNASADGTRQTVPDKRAAAKDKQKTDFWVKREQKMEWTTIAMTSESKQTAAVKQTKVKDKSLLGFHWPSQVPGGLAGRDRFRGEFEDGEI